jgi:hypothetical protein
MFDNDFKEDILVRQIRNIIRGALKIVFHVDTFSQFQQEMALDALASRLIKKAAAGDINGAENLLYVKTEAREPETLRAGVAFYEYLNNLDDAELQEHDFSREEIYEGLCHLLKTYDLNALAGLYSETPEPELSETPGYPSPEELNPAYFNYSVCPYCGKTMELGYIGGENLRTVFTALHKGSLYWCESVGEPFPQRLTEATYDKYGNPFVRAYRCVSCRRIIVHSEPE